MQVFFYYDVGSGTFLICASSWWGLQLQEDDSPLYIFDSSFDDQQQTSSLLADYCVPKYFREDLFSLVGERRRPPYRWFLVGPKRSGTCIHIDPLATSAWNTLIHGEKRWVLFPPETPRIVAKAKEFCRDDEDDEASDYFGRMLPRLKRAYGVMGVGGEVDNNSSCESRSRGDDMPGWTLPGGAPLRCIEFIQRPGETVFVPGGWWHGVLNTADSVAITQNFVSSVGLFCSERNFAQPYGYILSLCHPAPHQHRQILRRHGGKLGAGERKWRPSGFGRCAMPDLTWQP